MTSGHPEAPGERAKVVVRLDVEDIVTPLSDDAIIWIADLLNSRGIRGAFFVTGDKARALASRNRTDVFAALRGHDLGFHSDGHSRHPAISEYLQGCGWQDGRQEVVAREQVGAQLLMEVTDMELWGFCTPGTSWGPQVPGAVGLLGLRSHLNSFSRTSDGQEPHWFAEALCFGRAQSIGPIESDLASAASFADLTASLRPTIESAAAGGSVVQLYIGHPTMFVNSEFWDTANFANGRNPAPGVPLRQPRSRPAKQTRTMLSHLDSLLGQVQKYADVVPFAEVVQGSVPPPRLDPGQLDTTLKAARRAPGILTSSPWISPAQMLYLLCRRAAGRPLPPGELVPAVLGPTEPYPPEAGLPHALPAAVLRELAAALAAHVDAHGSIPWAAQTRDACLSAGVLYRTLLDSADGIGADGPVRISRGEQAPAVGTEMAAHLSRRSKAWLHEENLDVRCLAELTVAQSWSLRPAA